MTRGEAIEQLEVIEELNINQNLKELVMISLKDHYALREIVIHIECIINNIVSGIESDDECDLTAGIEIDTYINTLQTIKSLRGSYDS